MNLTPREREKLLVSLAAMVARNRLARGVKLNHPEAIALITDFVVEGARDGQQQRREQARLESEQRFRATFEQAAVGIAQLSPQGRWLRVNQRLHDHPGSDRAALLEHLRRQAAYIGPERRGRQA